MAKGETEGVPPTIRSLHWFTINITSNTFQKVIVAWVGKRGGIKGGAEKGR